MTNDWKKRGDTYTKRVGGLRLSVHGWTGSLSGRIFAWGVYMASDSTLLDGATDTRHRTPRAAQRAAERFVEKLRKAVKP
jgi:hypothetical protein